MHGCVSRAGIYMLVPLLNIHIETSTRLWQGLRFAWENLRQLSRPTGSAWQTEVPPTACPARCRIRSIRSTTRSWRRGWWSGSSPSVAPVWASPSQARPASRTGSRTDVWVRLTNTYKHSADSDCMLRGRAVSALCFSRSCVSSSTACMDPTSPSNPSRKPAFHLSRWSKYACSSKRRKATESPQLTCFRL